MRYGEIPKEFIQTGKEAFRNQAYYDSVMDALGSDKSQGAAQHSAPASEGSGFWLFALIAIILTAILSLFAGPESNPTTAVGQTAPGDGDDPTTCL